MNRAIEYNEGCVRGYIIILWKVKKLHNITSEYNKQVGNLSHFLDKREAFFIEYVTSAFPELTQVCM